MGIGHTPGYEYGVLGAPPRHRPGTYGVPTYLSKQLFRVFPSRGLPPRAHVDYHPRYLYIIPKQHKTYPRKTVLYVQPHLREGIPPEDRYARQSTNLGSNRRDSDSERTLGILLVFQRPCLSQKKLSPVLPCDAVVATRRSSDIYRSETRRYLGDFAYAQKEYIDLENGQRIPQ